MSGFSETLAAAENLWKHGDHDGAGLTLEELEPIAHVMPQVIDPRRTCGTSGGTAAEGAASHISPVSFCRRALRAVWAG